MSENTILDLTITLRQSRKGSEWENTQNKIQNEENVVQKGLIISFLSFYEGQILQLYI